MKDVSTMTDAELSALIEQADLAAAAREEQERRRAEAEAEGVKVVSLPTPSVRRASKAACPSCGRNDDWIQSKTLYDSPDLAHGGKEIGTAVYCRCGAWYDSTTGEFVSMGKAYTY